MKALRELTTAVFCLALIGAIVSPHAKADTVGQKTVVRFSAPVEIPGVHVVRQGVLPAGTYVFRLLDSSANRHILQISSEDSPNPTKGRERAQAYPPAPTQVDQDVFETAPKAVSSLLLVLVGLFALVALCGPLFLRLAQKRSQ
jgi:hypothetical protein